MQHTTMKKISPTPKIEREYKDIDYDRFKYLPLTEEAIEFINYVIKVFKDEDLDNFYNNINEVGIFLHSKFGNGRNYYSITTNDIYIEEEESIIHELFHSISSTMKDGVHYSGFFQTGEKYTVGIGINEGYTDLLANRYLNEDLFGFYREEGFYVGLLECVVGRKKMSELYLNADLLGLIEELNKYSSIKSILSFIDRMDYILSVKRFALTNTLSDAVISEYSESFDVVNKFIIKIYLKKWKERYNHFEELNDEDNLDKLLDELELFLELIVDFNVVTDEDTQEQLLLLDPDKLEKDVAKAIGVKKIKIFEYV